MYILSELNSLANLYSIVNIKIGIISCIGIRMEWLFDIQEDNLKCINSAILFITGY